MQRNTLTLTWSSASLSTLFKLKLMLERKEKTQKRKQEPKWQQEKITRLRVSSWPWSSKIAARVLNENLTQQRLQVHRFKPVMPLISLHRLLKERILHHRLKENLKLTRLHRITQLKMQKQITIHFQWWDGRFQAQNQSQSLPTLRSKIQMQRWTKRLTI